MLGAGRGPLAEVPAPAGAAGRDERLLLALLRAGVAGADRDERAVAGSGRSAGSSSS
jgi:hypothetical protein